MYQSEIQNIAHLKIFLTKIGRNLILSIVFLKIELTYFGENDKVYQAFDEQNLKTILKVIYCAEI